jgi:hypothetical protein
MDDGFGVKLDFMWSRPYHFNAGSNILLRTEDQNRGLLKVNALNPK